MNRLLIVTYYRYPGGDAGSVRQHSFAKLYKELGYDVTVVGMGACTNFQLKNNDGVPYVSLRCAQNTLSAKVKNYFGFNSRLKRFLKSYGDCEYIQIVDVPVNALFFLKKYAEKHNIRLIHDSVEWYSPEQFRLGRFSLPYILKEKYNTKWIDKQFSVIAISSFLEKHFKSRGINTVRIPVIMNVSAMRCEKRTAEDKTVFLYAGSPGKKDYLAEIIKGFSLLPQEILSRVELQLLGINKEKLTVLCGVEESAVEYMGNSLVCLGRVPREEVLNRLAAADFTVLLRSETQRYAKAGFPTKAVESLSTATPIITNLTSDLGLYLKDGYNSIIVSDCSPTAFSKALEKALCLSSEEKKLMYINARKTAEDHFDYRLYNLIISDLLNKEDK